MRTCGHTDGPSDQSAQCEDRQWPVLAPVCAPLVSVESLVGSCFFKTFFLNRTFPIPFVSLRRLHVSFIDKMVFPSSVFDSSAATAARCLDVALPVPSAPRFSERWVRFFF